MMSLETLNRSQCHVMRQSWRKRIQLPCQAAVEEAAVVTEGDLLAVSGVSLEINTSPTPQWSLERTAVLPTV